MEFDNRITRMLGVEVPIVQAPMGWIARSQLAAAVSNSGALGIIETSSGELDAIREEILKIASVRANAQYILDVRAEHGSFQSFLTEWPNDDFVGLWEHLKKNGSRLGGQTGRYFLRFIGYDSPIFSKDVVAALVQADVVDKEPTSKKAQLTTQEAFVTWQQESGRSFKEISRVLAMSTG